MILILVIDEKVQTFVVLDEADAKNWFKLRFAQFGIGVSEAYLIRDADQRLPVREWTQEFSKEEI